MQLKKREINRWKTKSSYSLFPARMIHPIMLDWLIPLCPNMFTGMCTIVVRHGNLNHTTQLQSTAVATAIVSTPFECLNPNGTWNIYLSTSLCKTQRRTQNHTYSQTYSHDTHDTQTNKKKESKWDTNLEITTELLLQNINIAKKNCFTFIFVVVAFFHLFIYLIIFVCAISTSDDKKKIQIKSQKKNKIDR